MGFRNGAFATVWDKKQVSPMLRISISKKNKETGKYDQDFSGFVAVVGREAAAEANKLKPKDRIKLGDCDVTTKYDKAKNITYTNFTVFGFTNASSNGRNTYTQARRQAVDEPMEGETPDSELPF